VYRVSRDAVRSFWKRYPSYVLLLCVSVIYFLTCYMYKSSLRHTHDPVLSSLKMKGISLLLFLTRCITFTFVFTIRTVGSLCSYTLINMWLNMKETKKKSYCIRSSNLIYTVRLSVNASRLFFSLMTVDNTFHYIPHTAKSSTEHGSEFGRWNFQTVV
jgi:hypothetical protein